MSTGDTAIDVRDVQIESGMELAQVRAGYGRIDVLHGIDLALAPGEVFALLGPNGAGKSSTLAVA